MREFDHIGLPSDQLRSDERFVERTQVWVTDPHAHPFRVEWLRYLPGSTAPEKLRRTPHVAYHVDSIEVEAAGLTALLAPFSSVAGHRVGFYETNDGAVIELMEF